MKRRIMNRGFFGRKTEGNNHWESLDVSGKIITKLISEKDPKFCTVTNL
jgi:hypothetical protein